MQLPRRTVLAALAGTLAGCDLRWPGRSADPASRAMTDAELLRTVAVDALDLAERYDAAIARSGEQAARLTPLRDAHREHARALARLIDESPRPVPNASPSGSAPSLKALADGELAAADRASITCLQVATFHAPLVGTIAACRASHAEALTGR